MTAAKKKTKKKVAKKKVAKKTGAKKEKREIKGAAHVKDFMVALVHAGIVDDIPEKGGDRNRLAMKVRQMAVALARQADKIDGGDDE